MDQPDHCGMGVSVRRRLFESDSPFLITGMDEIRRCGSGDFPREKPLLARAPDLEHRLWTDISVQTSSPLRKECMEQVSFESESEKNLKVEVISLSNKCSALEQEIWVSEDQIVHCSKFQLFLCRI